MTAGKIGRSPRGESHRGTGRELVIAAPPARPGCDEMSRAPPVVEPYRNSMLGISPASPPDLRNASFEGTPMPHRTLLAMAIAGLAALPAMAQDDLVAA